MRISPLELKNEKDSKCLLAHLGVSSQGIDILSFKSRFLAFKIEGIKSWEANIIKQHLLSLGADAAIARDALVKNIKTDILIFGSISQIKKLSEKLDNQPFNLRGVSKELSRCLENLARDEYVFCAGGKLLKIKKPIICGIINVTFDSFSGDGLLTKSRSLSLKVQELALRQAERMIKDGAKIIDIGAESSRPNSKPISEKEEIERITPSLKALRKEFKNILISVDTYKYRVAKQAAECGADIINDITALRCSPQIAALVKKYKLGCVLMHMKGRPANMQVNPKYKDVVLEQIDFFKERLEFCDKFGIRKEQLCIDPGIGFGKRLEDNTMIIKELYKLKMFGLPIFLGLSRKSFIGKILKNKAEDRLLGTIAASILSINKGANILRVHDVKETNQAIRLATRLS